MLICRNDALSGILCKQETSVIIHNLTGHSHSHSFKLKIGARR